MALQVSTRTRVIHDLIENNTGAGVGEVSSVLRHDVNFDTGTLTTGTGSNQQDRIWSDAQSVANGAPDTWDLAGTLTSALSGDTVTFVEITGIWILNKSTTTGEYLQVGGGSNAFASWLGASGDIVNVGPGGWLSLGSPIDGWTVTAGTGDILQVASASGTISYDIAVWGRSA